MRNTYTLPAHIAIPTADAGISTILKFSPDHVCYLSTEAGALEMDSDGNPILICFDESTGQAYARVATFNPGDGGDDDSAITSQGALPNFKGKPEHHGYFVPVQATVVPAGGVQPLVGNAVGVLPALMAGVETGLPTARIDVAGGDHSVGIGGGVGA
jgi:hypothetical protein